MAPSGATAGSPPEPVKAAGLEVLDQIQRRVLWLSTYIVHYANKLRPNDSGLKVGGHQASSASSVSILTSLFFDFMRSGDRLSVKPHASPVLQAIHYLLGNLDRSYLTTLRQFHGLQAYPSRTKDPYPVDFSTGSVGLGSVAPNFAALAERYLDARFSPSTGPTARFITLVGDAELDEGSIWEAIAEPALRGLGNLIWIVDLNRQSLDRVVPGIRVHELEAMFRANGWNVLEAKYGRLIQQASAESGGELQRLIDDLSNEQYQLLLRSDVAAVREALGTWLVQDRSDDEVRRLIRDLGGHDVHVLREQLRRADESPAPTVLFAYTIKGWGLPIAGDPLNHSALLTTEQIQQLQLDLGIPSDDPWASFPPESDAGRVCRERGPAISAPPRTSAPRLNVPADLDRNYGASTSTQRAFGLILTDLARTSPDTGARIVTVSPDVATSTNLGGWINRAGLWQGQEESDSFGTLGPRLIRWERHPRGQHIELGISETNLCMLLGQLGLSAELFGEPLLPIGTLYDPFVARALDALTYGVYGGGRFVLVGTPSGVTLSPEGGAHQSVVTPSIGLALPRITYYEPCFAIELEWVLLEALRKLHDGEQAESAYLRLSTAPIDQTLLAIDDREALRRQILSGAYRVIDSRPDPACEAGCNLVEIWATGVMVPEAVRASQALAAQGIFANVWNCVSPDLVYRQWQRAVHESLQSSAAASLDFRADGPIVTVIDGHPSALAWVGSMLGRNAWPLGVMRFGESGTPQDLYEACRIDWQCIASACKAALARQR